jgi:hypothetical protein
MEKKMQKREAFQVARQTDKKNISGLWKARKIEKKEEGRGNMEIEKNMGNIWNGEGR